MDLLSHQLESPIPVPKKLKKKQLRYCINKIE